MQEINEALAKIDWKSVASTLFCREQCEYLLSLHNFTLKSGITKAVLVPKNKENPYVIKIPFKYDYDFEGECWEFEYAPTPISKEWSSWNYCNTELELYMLAQEEPFKKFFPETILYRAEPYPVYLQERCMSFSENSKNTIHSKEVITQTWESLTVKKKQAEGISYYINSFDINWIIDAINYYSENCLFNLFKFLHKNKIGDFHIGNYGYSCWDGRPILIDFSGYAE